VKAGTFLLASLCFAEAGGVTTVVGVGTGGTKIFTGVVVVPVV